MRHFAKHNDSVISERKKTLSRYITLSLAALGVVYGDIGTSPLYAVRESLMYVELTDDNIYGVLSMIFWSLILVVSLKYLWIILKVDNDGEGGTIALLSLFKIKEYKPKTFTLLYLLGLFGTGLLYSDGMITPAISVVSAVEGLSIVSPRFHILVVPTATIILLILFLFQSRGTEKVGNLFSPIMLVWFGTLSVLGVWSIFHAPSVLNAINPHYAVHFFLQNGFQSFHVLTGVFLVVTGGEALYADISHFGKLPIRISWYLIVFPALILNYFGQGADLMIHPEHLKNPFYLLAPHWFLYPLLIIATLATIIASQAMISAVFSLSKQAINLQFLPRLSVVFTSADIKGQVYVPTVNFITAVGTLLLVIFFQTSGNLAHAYGLAVNLDMVIVTILVSTISFVQFGWSTFKVSLFVGIFLSIDCIFLLANSLKILHMGWFPIVIAIFITVIMVIWRQGLRLLQKATTRRKITIREIASRSNAKDIVTVPKVAVFVNEPYDESKSCLYRQLESTSTVHETTVLLDICIEDKPLVAIEKRLELYKQLSGIHHIVLHYGYMQEIDVPNTLRVCKQRENLGFLEDSDDIVYYLEMIKAEISHQYNQNVPLWQKKIFLFMLNNLMQNINYYSLPLNKTIMIGTYYEI